MRYVAVLVCAMLLLSLPQAEAVDIGFNPATLSVAPGDSVALDLLATDLGGSLLGDFDLDIAFDAGQLTLTGFMLSDALGDVGLGEALDFSAGLVAPGLLNLVLVSTLSNADLALLQSEPLLLATLEFTVDSLAPGGTGVMVGVNALGDGNGDALPVGTLGEAALRPATGTTVVPEPGTLLLLASGLVALYGVQRRTARGDRGRLG